jgi:hypothetical protein
MRLLSILRSIARVSSVSIPSYQHAGDRALQRMKIQPFWILILSTLQSLIVVNSVKSQISNELAFETSVLRMIGQKAPSIDSLSGFLTERLRTEILLTDPSNRQLFIETPSVVFAPLGHRKFERTISTVLTLTDTIEVSFPLVYLDTVAKSQLRAVRRSRLIELRGADPRWPQKYLLPVALIGTGIAGIILLFYIRS